MGWIRWTGKTLEFVGKLAQTASFEAWAESQGEKIIEGLALKSGGILFGLGKEKKAKSVVWDDLERIADQSPALNAAIQEFVAHYPKILSSLASKYNSLPHQSVYLVVVPRFLVNRDALIEVKKRLDGSEELGNLKGGPIFRAFFFEELIRQLDDAFTEQAIKTTPDKPLNVEGTWIVGFDQHYKWNGESGHYYIYSSYSHTRESADNKDKKEGRKEAASLLIKCQSWLGTLTQQERDSLASKLP